MIAVPPLTRQNEPAAFDRNCRVPGAGWLAAHPYEDPHTQSKWWRDFKPDLAAHFSYRCGWDATYIGLNGIVEHRLSCGRRVPSSNRHLAFEWTNYRYSTTTINSLKGTLDDKILDPCEVRDGWFKILLPSFQLVVTEHLPSALLAKAEFTLERLQLRRGDYARWTRWSWYARNWNGGTPNFAGLDHDAPLVGKAVRNALTLGLPLPDPGDYEPILRVVLRQRRYSPRRFVTQRQE